MEKRVLNVYFGRSGSGSVSPTVSLPKTFLDKINVTDKERQILMKLDETTGIITIQKYSEEKN